VQCKHCGQELSDAEIISHVQRLRSGLRKNKRGGRPKPHQCPRCGEVIMGQRMLYAHLALCRSGPPGPLDPGDLVGVSDADMLAMAWTADGEA
jgi:hypothetical protein